MSFKMTFNGRPFNSGDFARELERGVAEVAKGMIEERLEDELRDPVTGEAPQVSIKTKVEKLSDLDGMIASIEGGPDITKRLGKVVTSEENEK
ncbi:MAG: hypothetical protein J0M12_02795 [Deltaproteobacteria bacterium]|nr:hypothetical protein [Deltaproteobacteria bacterium]